VTKLSAVAAAIRAAALLILCLELTACLRPVRAPAPSAPPASQSSPPSLPPPADRQAVSYRIDPQASDLHILVFRGGTFARLGHNHVVSSKAVTGRIWMQPGFVGSGFELSFPVAELIVDDPEARRAAGSDFPPDVPAADKEGTRENMLRKEVLDAEVYPRVTVKSATVAGSLQAPQITARITIKLTVNGEFEILQTEFGMKPFSVALGALTVQDRLQVRFKLVATRNEVTAGRGGPAVRQLNVPRATRSRDPSLHTHP
jgi:polyisoprenoid-binding protein YceI